jgi:hypothetical protein
MDSLFGFGKLSDQAPLKVKNIDTIFNEQKQQKQEIVFCPDGSRSTAFRQQKFDEYYAEALCILSTHRVVCCSSRAK